VPPTLPCLTRNPSGSRPNSDGLFGGLSARQRGIVEDYGGTARGPAFNGKVLPGGADFQLIRSETVSDLDARYVVETDDGEHLFVTNFAYRTGRPEDIAALGRGEAVPAERIYFRCSPRFEVSGHRLSWLDSTVVIGSGRREPESVIIDLWDVL
jgi:hypothetical protein